MMEALIASKKKMSELYSGLTIYPQILENVRVKDKSLTLSDPDVMKAVRSAESKLGSAGRILVRESGTEPLIRVMAEAETEEQCKKYVGDIVKVIKEKGYAV